MDRFDVVIVGAGVIGLALARRLSLDPAYTDRTIVILEREASFGQQTSSRNSEVIHAGIYYPPDSLKASLCVEGKRLLYAYCEQFDIPHRRIGKLIVGKQSQAVQLEALQANARACGVDDLQWLDRQALATLEPAVRGDIALLSPSSGIIDSHAFMQSLLDQAQQRGVVFAPLTTVERIAPASDGFEIVTQIQQGAALEPYTLGAATVINCAGLQSQALASTLTGSELPIPALHPCKGDYFSYQGKNPFSHLIYPLPEPDTRGLGVHVTVDMGGQLRFGPDTRYVDRLDYDIDAGKAADFARAIADYFPAIEAERLAPSYAGIRPKLSGPGDAAADFVIQNGADWGMPGLMQLFGIESPGLTAALAIADRVAVELQKSAVR